MGITNSVGKGGKNLKEDVKVIQAALSLVKNNKFKLTSKLDVDGKIGNRTIAAIELFQSSVIGMKTPDGLVAVNGKTIQSLKASMQKGLNANSFAAIMANGSKSKLQTYFALFQTKLPHYQITSPLRIAHFLAQVGHESFSLTYTEELASGEAYEGRKDLGNTQTGDGKRFKGRGLIQLTGRNNYEAYSNDSGLDLMKSGNEALISTVPANALDVSLWFWKQRNLNKRADMDDLRGITRRVNGGYNGLDDREKYLGRAKFFLMQ
jgi:putative chitinase